MITIGLFGIFSFKIIYFRKFVDYLKGSTGKLGLNASGFFQPEDMFKLCFNFNETQPIYTCKCYPCIKKTVQVPEESLVTSFFVCVTTFHKLSYPFSEQCIVFHTVYHRKFQGNYLKF